ncbi:MAG: HAD family hydrolase [Pontiellaceae bacterium]|nr:HAD family hydrolase [Pontiellaceae bacterium]
MVGTIRHIVWDWNGTLWDDTWLCVEINNHMLARRNLPPVNVETYRDKLCFPVDQYYCQLGFDYDVDPYCELAREFIDEYTRRRFECPLHKGAKELIGHLHKQGLAQTVLSAYQHETLLQAIDHFELRPFFSDIIGLNDIYAAGKVENGIKYIATLDIDPSEVLFIGDTLHDFDVAEAMGVKSALIAHGHNSRARLETCGVPVYDSLDALELD